MYVLSQAHLQFQVVIANLVKAFMPCALLGSSHDSFLSQEPKSERNIITHLYLVWVAFPEVIPDHSLVFLGSLQDKVVSATLLPAFLLGALATRIHGQTTHQRINETMEAPHGQAQLCGSLAWVPMVLALYSMFRCRGM